MSIPDPSMPDDRFVELGMIQMKDITDLTAKLKDAEAKNARLRDAILHIRGVAATDGFVSMVWLIDRCDLALEVRK